MTGEPVDIAPTLDLTGDQTITTTVSGQFADNFNGTLTVASAANNSTGTTPWTSSWIETADDTNIRTGQIQIDTGSFLIANGLTNEMRFLNGDGATITRAVNLAGVTTATLSFDVDQNGLDTGETVSVQFDANGDGTFETVLSAIATGSSSTGATSTVTLAGGTANSAIRFVASAIAGAGEDVRIDNVVINTTTTSSTVVPGAPGNNYTTTFIEPGTAANGTAVAISSSSSIVDNAPGQLLAATVTLTNAKAGDVLSVSGLAALGLSSSINTAVAGVITLNISGVGTLAEYQTAINAVRFQNTSQNPDTMARSISVSVHDGVNASATATGTVNVVATNDPMVANDDRVVTNAVNTPIVLPEWVLLANDTDPDSTVDVTAVTESSSGFSASLGAAGVTITDTDGTSNAFTYTGTGTDTASVAVVRDATGAVDGGTGNDILVGNAAASTFNGNGGNDIILAGDGNDTINWSITNGGTSDGRDFMDGGAGALDRVVINGNNSVETFNVYSNTDDWDNNAGNGIVSSAVHAGLTGLNANTEIVITRNGAIIAELDNIEEITINTSGGNDTVTPIGSFNPTSLNFNTIRVNGGLGNDTVDISALSSDHRVVLTGNGGIDRIIGGDRPQDVVIEGTPTPVAPTVHHYATSSRDVLRGTDGEDMFHFGSVHKARNDTITEFEPGDRIDLSAIDAVRGVFGNQSFTLVSGDLAQKGQLMVEHETRNGEDFTVIYANTAGDDRAEFKIKIKGEHDLTNADFIF